jgi:phosphatidylserine/phosphatidylglycerophosphate/cardiolipin synthase-like enzyme
VLPDTSLLTQVLKQLQRKNAPVRGSEILAELPGMTEEDIYSLLSHGVLKPYASGPDIQDHRFWIESTDMPPLPKQHQEQVSENPTIVATIPFKEFTPIRGLKSLYAELCRLIIGSDNQISIINPFFDRDGREKMLTYLEGALDRGVVVRILSRGKAGGQATTFIRPLKSRAKEGVDVRMLPRGRETAVHAKLLIADSKSAYVGSANLTGRSLAFNLELGVILTGNAASILDNIFDQLWSISIS